MRKTQLPAMHQVSDSPPATKQNKHTSSHKLFQSVSNLLHLWNLMMPPVPKHYLSGHSTKLIPHPCSPLPTSFILFEILKMAGWFLSCFHLLYFNKCCWMTCIKLNLMVEGAHTLIIHKKYRALAILPRTWNLLSVLPYTLPN